jgi:hypothetical protein
LLQRLLKETGQPPQQGLWDTLDALIRLCLPGITDDSFEAIMRLRVGAGPSKEESLLKLDGVLACLSSEERDDAEKFIDNEESKRVHATEYVTKLHDWRVAAGRVPVPVPAAGRGRGGRAGAKGRGRGGALGTIIPDGVLSAAQISALLPPGWTCTIVPRVSQYQLRSPHLSVSRSWVLHGKRGAALMCLQVVWQLHKLRTGEDCHIVFPAA